MKTCEAFSFTARGHPNITARHKNTFEFTKESHVTEAGDCVIGVEAGFFVPESFLEQGWPVIIEIEAGGLSESVKAESSPAFRNGDELVVRKSGFISERTFATNADRVCSDFSPEFRSMLKDPASVIRVVVKKG